jgi:tRNA pseudouridine55 synthase
MEAWRRKQSSVYAELPLAYAGRLDPMASGQLLILIGDECKKQTQYHSLDKVYQFSVLFGIGSDTDDVLGRLTPTKLIPSPTESEIRHTLQDLEGVVSLPYPHFSSKTVQGKPLHTWTLEGRLHEISVPVNTTRVYRLKLTKVETKMRASIYEEALEKINSVAPVTDPKKALGADFRRSDVRADWLAWRDAGPVTDRFTIAYFTCTAGSGTYMRSLAAEIGNRLGTRALAYHIDRTRIGQYVSLPLGVGFWRRIYK